MDVSAIRYGAQIERAALDHGLDPALLAAVAAQETGGPGASSGNNVVGDGGHGRGLFQIDDRFWAFARSPGAMDPAKNADFAAGLLSSDLARSGGDVRAALSTYNAGSPEATGTTTTWPDGTTLGYADSVLRHYQALDATPSASAATAAVDATIDPALLADQSAALGPLASTSPTAAAPIASWLQVSSAGSQVGSNADAAIADLVDGGDVFGSSDDDD